MTTQDDERLASQAIEAGDYQKAMSLLQPLVESDSEYALLTLGWICETGAINPPDKKAARSYYERAAALGGSSACLRLGWLLLEEGADYEARRAFERGARLGDEECKSVLARLDDNDQEKSAAEAMKAARYDEAVQLLCPLAERGSEYALLCLGWIYETGAAGTSDEEAARALFERAAAGGSGPACFDLGRLLLRRGEEVQARSAFETGAERGDMASMAQLGKLMVEGRGGPSDVTSGTAWLEKAAEQGHIFAQRTLLDLEARNASSVADKLAIKMKIAALVKRGATEMLRDPHSDRLR